MSKYQELIELLAQKNAKLIAVSKSKPNTVILSLYHQGQRDFGENRVQEILEKQSTLPKDIKWHFIGHLQRNKVKYIVDFVHLIQSVDNLKLAKTINKEAVKSNRKIDVLLQIKIAQEDSKYGYDANDLIKQIEALKELSNIEICGVMGMGTFTDDSKVTRNEFSKLKEIFKLLKDQHFNHTKSFKEISMGMSGDYTIALEQGSTMVRIGSLLFGSR